MVTPVKEFWHQSKFVGNLLGKFTCLGNFCQFAYMNKTYYEFNITENAQLN
jgi:hypothetical protein